jgi:hypothetical protein
MLTAWWSFTMIVFLNCVDNGYGFPSQVIVFFTVKLIGPSGLLASSAADAPTLSVNIRFEFSGMPLSIE